MLAPIALSTPAVGLSRLAKQELIPISANTKTTQQLEQEVVLEKAYRVERLTRFLEKYNSPMVSQAETYIEVADTYGLDWKFLPAISGVESGFGAVLLGGSYNPFGWGGGYIYFDSWEDGIETVGSQLAERFPEGTRTPEAIGPTYCPPNTAYWIAGVNQFMSELEATPAT